VKASLESNIYQVVSQRSLKGFSIKLAQRESSDFIGKIAVKPEIFRKNIKTGGDIL